MYIKTNILQVYDRDIVIYRDILDILEPFFLISCTLYICSQTSQAALQSFQVFFHWDRASICASHRRCRRPGLPANGDDLEILCGIQVYYDRYDISNPQDFKLELVFWLVLKVESLTSTKKCNPWHHKHI